jgi:hypothetical protein
VTIQPFSPEKIEELKALFTRNANAPDFQKKDCIRILNAGMELIYGDRILPLGTAVHETMELMEKKGKASKPRIILFKDQKGQVTYGEDHPHKLNARTMAVMQNMAHNKFGWHIFALSVMDGYHSVTLLLNNIQEPVVYWCDQWNLKNLKCLGGTMKFGGCKRMNGFNLDAVITELTQRWWEHETDPLKKHKTRATLWRLSPPK